MPKLKSLPWKVAPKPDQIIEVGDAEHGMLEIPRKNSLTINEAHFIRENTKDLPDVQQQATLLAVEISEAEGMELAEAFEALTSGAVTSTIVITKAAKKGDTTLFVSTKHDLSTGSIVRLPDGNLVVLKEDATLTSDKVTVEAIAEDIPANTVGNVSVASKVAQKYILKLMEFQRQSTELAPLRNAVLATAMVRRIMGNDWTIDQTSEEMPVSVINALAEFCAKEMNGWDQGDDDSEPEPLTEETLKND